MDNKGTDFKNLIGRSLEGAESNYLVASHAESAREEFTSRANTIIRQIGQTRGTSPAIQSATLEYYGVVGAAPKLAGSNIIDNVAPTLAENANSITVRGAYRGAGSAAAVSATEPTHTSALRSSLTNQRRSPGLKPAP